MIAITEENRDEVISALVNTIVENMDHSEMVGIVEDYICSNYSSYSNAELETEVNENYPDLFEDEDECNE